VPAQDLGRRPVRHHYLRAEMPGAADVVVMRVGIDHVGNRRLADPPDRRDVLRAP